MIDPELFSVVADRLVGLKGTKMIADEEVEKLRQMAIEAGRKRLRRKGSENRLRAVVNQTMTRLESEAKPDPTRWKESLWPEG